MEGTAMAAIDPLTAGGVLLATALTDAVLCHVHVGRGGAKARARGDLEQHLVSALVLCRDLLYGELGLCRVCGNRFMARRICIDHFPASATRRAADRRRAGDLDTPAQSRDANCVRDR